MTLAAGLDTNVGPLTLLDRRKRMDTIGAPDSCGTAMAISDRELWACANQVLDHHGPDADRFIAERKSALASAGDAAGSEAWLAIAKRVDQLRDLRGNLKSRH